MIQGGCYGENFSWNIADAWNQERQWIHQGGLGEKHGNVFDDSRLGWTCVNEHSLGAIGEGVCGSESGYG